MKNTSDRWLKELDVLIHDCGQSTVIVDSPKREERLTIEQYRDELMSSKKMLYIDFKTVHNMYDIAKKLSQQYSDIFEQMFSESIHKTINFYITQKEDYFLDKILNILKEVSEKYTDPVILWLENFTEVLKLEDSRRICNLMRGHYQDQEKVIYIFTSNSIEDVNAIFNDYSKPFYRSARILKTYTVSKFTEAKEGVKT
ncbi:MAG: hypothetical protein ABFQ64_06690 [Campylobacterota bacterium]